MVVAGRRKTIAFFIALGAGLILVTLALYFGLVLPLNWRHGIQLFLGALLVLTIIAGMVLNTIFLVREIRRNAQHDAFINSVTHELKTPVASIRLYLETLQSRPTDSFWPHRNSDQRKTESRRRHPEFRNTTAPGLPLYAARRRYADAKPESRPPAGWLARRKR